VCREGHNCSTSRNMLALLGHPSARSPDSPGDPGTPHLPRRCARACVCVCVPVRERTWWRWMVDHGWRVAGGVDPGIPMWFSGGILRNQTPVPKIRLKTGRMTGLSSPPQHSRAFPHDPSSPAPPHANMRACPNSQAPVVTQSSRLSHLTPLYSYTPALSRYPTHPHTHSHTRTHPPALSPS
jgi:hypothetical protein